MAEGGTENSPKCESDDLSFLFDDWETNEINVSLKANQLSSEKRTKPVVEIKKTETVKESRFTEVDEQFVTNFVLEHENANTKCKTLGHLKLLEEYLEKNNETRPIHEVPAPALNSILSRFFLSIRQNDGSEYEPATLRVTFSSKEKLNSVGDMKRIAGDEVISSNTVEVQGLSADTSQEVVEMYFENSRRSGGGDIEEVQIKDGTAYITFVEAETAQRVVSRSSHQVVGQTLNVTLYHPPLSKPCYDNRVLVQELNSAVTEEILTNFLATETGAKVTEILYGEEAGRVVVTFSSCIDFDALRKACRKKRIKSTFLQVARVVISNCILVWNLQLSASHELILLYFENKKRSGGGEVERVEMVPEERYCLVYFEDNSVIDRVLSQTHKIDGADVKVHLHHECLGRRSSTDRSHLCIKISNTGNKGSVAR